MAQARKPVPAGYQVTDRDGAFWCQREIMPGIWQDIGGPYRQRISAVQKAERDSAKRTPAVRRNGR